MTIVNDSRRDFLKVSSALGGGLIVGLHLPAAAAAAREAATEVNAWIVIHPDDRVVIRIARSEMGQGSSTGLAMLVAEELECDWKKVRLEYASPNEQVKRNRVWGNMSTGGSRAIRDSQDYLRKAGAAAREMLIAAAAAGWKVPASDCKAANGVITHAPSGRKTTFGKVAEAAAKLTAPAGVKLKEPKDWRLIGKRTPRLDIPDSVTGSTVFGIDVKLPGMVYAALAQCPVFKGSVKNVDSAAALARRGVQQVLTFEDFVAVVADNWWRAQQALAALKVEWDDGGNGGVSSASISALLKSGLDDSKAAVAREEGDVGKAFADAAKVIEGEYYTPFLAHSPMEPMNCTAWLKGDRLDVWVSTQNAEASLAAASEASGLPLASVEVHKTQLGGGFGRRGTQDFVTLAVRVAGKLPGTPVKVLWTREEDIQHDFYRPVSMVRQKAALDGAGNLIAWRARISSQSIAARSRPDAKGIDPQAVICYSDSPYSVPNFLVDYAMRNTHVPVGAWRSVAHSQNPFFRECFIDEIAHAAGKDPYAMRRELLDKAPKYLGVLDACAKAAGWDKPLAAGVHRGIAVVDGYGSYASAVFEVAVGANKRLAIKRVVVAVDPGYVVNPDSAEAQIESAVTYGLSAVLFGEITLKDGRVEQSNFNDYPAMLLRDMPKVEAVLAPSGGFWGGMGEPPLTPLGPALCNAIFAATGERIRSLPLKNHGYTLA